MGNTQTLHWYFSAGTQNRPAVYYLEDSLIAQIQKSGVFDLSEVDHPTSYVSKACSSTAGILNLISHLNHSGRRWKIRLRCVETKELRSKSIDDRIPLEVLKDELPFDSEKIELSQTDLVDPAYPITDFSPSGMEGIISWILGSEISQLNEGDAVFFEATSGLRPIQMGFTLSAELLRVLRPDVKIVGLSYAELGRVTQKAHRDAGMITSVHGELSPKDDLSPCYDLMDLLSLPSWASALKSLRDRLDTRWLTELLEQTSSESPAIKSLIENLDHFNESFGLGLVDETIEPLIKITEHLRAPDELSLGSAWKAVSPYLTEVTTGLLPEQVLDGDLTKETIKFHLRISDALTESGRLGDSIRVLREVMVSRRLLAINGQNTQSARRGAEKDLNQLLKGEVKEIWREICDLRNPLSHVGQASEHEDLLSDLRVALNPTTGDSLVSRLKVILEEDEHWIVVESVRETPKIIWIYRSLVEVNYDLHDMWIMPLERYEANKKLDRPTSKRTVTPFTAEGYELIDLTASDQATSDEAIGGRKVRNKAGSKKLKHLVKDTQDIVISSSGIELQLLIKLINYFHDNEILCWEWKPPQDGSKGGPFGTLKPLFSKELAEKVLRHRRGD